MFPVWTNKPVEIWLVILFLSMKKFHAKHIFVLSSSMKLGPDVIPVDSKGVEVVLG